jgi:hypothetical protein
VKCWRAVSHFLSRAFHSDKLQQCAGSSKRSSGIVIDHFCK